MGDTQSAPGVATVCRLSVSVEVKSRGGGLGDGVFVIGFLSLFSKIAISSSSLSESSCSWNPPYGVLGGRNLSLSSSDSESAVAEYLSDVVKDLKIVFLVGTRPLKIGLLEGKGLGCGGGEGGLVTTGGGEGEGEDSKGDMESSTISGG